MLIQNINPTSIFVGFHLNTIQIKNLSSCLQRLYTCTFPFNCSCLVHFSKICSGAYQHKNMHIKKKKLVPQSTPSRSLLKRLKIFFKSCCISTMKQLNWVEWIRLPRDQIRNSKQYFKYSEMMYIPFTQNLLIPSLFLPVILLFCKIAFLIETITPVIYFLCFSTYFGDSNSSPEEAIYFYRAYIIALKNPFGDSGMKKVSKFNLLFGIFLRRPRCQIHKLFKNNLRPREKPETGTLTIKMVKTHRSGNVLQVERTLKL